MGLLQKIRDKEHNQFDSFILLVILFSAILIGFETDVNLFVSFKGYFHIADIIILAIFIVEIGIKIFAQGMKPWRYFHDPWNIFDFVIVMLSFLPFILSHGQDDTHALAAFRVIRLVRAVRVLRVFRIVTHVKHLQVLVETLIKSIPSLSYVLLLLGIIFYIYGVIGVFIFGHYDATHFSNIGQSILTLFECATGNWTSILDNLYQAQGLSHLWLIPLYFISFYILAGLIVLNLFIGIIVSELSAVKSRNEIEDIRKGFEDDLSIQSSKLLAELDEQMLQINQTFKSLKLSLDKDKGKVDIE